MEGALEVGMKESLQNQHGVGNEESTESGGLRLAEAYRWGLYIPHHQPEKLCENGEYPCQPSGYLKEVSMIVEF